MSPWLTVVGIGEDGFKGLGRNARHALLRATRIIGAQRQLDLLPVCIRGERQVWPSPFSLEPVLAQRGDAGVCAGQRRSDVLWRGGQSGAAGARLKNC